MLLCCIGERFWIRSGMTVMEYFFCHFGFEPKSIKCVSIQYYKR